MKQKIIYLTIVAGVSTLVGFIYVIFNNWFGKGDIQGFAVFSLILSSLSLLQFNFIKKLFARFKILPALFFVLLISVIQTIIFITIVWFILGPWIGAYSFPIIWCWLSGIIMGNFYVLIISENNFKFKHFGSGLSVIGILLLSIYTFNKIEEHLSTEQNFDIICLVYRPSETKPELKDLTKYSLTQKEAQAILDLGLKGTFWTDKFFRISKSKLVSTDFPSFDIDNMDKNKTPVNVFLELMKDEKVSVPLLSAYLFTGHSICTNASSQLEIALKILKEQKIFSSYLDKDHCSGLFSSENKSMKVKRIGIFNQSLNNTVQMQIIEKYED